METAVVAAAVDRVDFMVLLELLSLKEQGKAQAEVEQDYWVNMETASAQCPRVEHMVQAQAQVNPLGVTGGLVELQVTMVGSTQIIFQHPFQHNRHRVLLQVMAVLEAHMAAGQGV
jgi:hypothetical protein